MENTLMSIIPKESGIKKKKTENPQDKVALRTQDKSTVAGQTGR